MTEKVEVAAYVSTAVVEVLESDGPAGPLNPDTPLETFGVDSLMLVDLAVLLERKYLIQIEDDEFDGSETINQIAESLVPRIAA
ncbi:acyl carrier protein [Millisia brevis]|uniref:acyl carrier protein n=1 Tax=Millisia brevis TaxID=264148 RepID=UPI0008323D84|nr:acyl carrier protein [Millisia brevis]